MVDIEVTRHAIEASWPRATRGSTLDPRDKLQVVYDKYVVKSKPQRGCTFNLIFLHGTGMNKSIWRYYVEELVRISQEPESKFQLHSLVAVDCVSHGDSAVLNSGKLGPEFVWLDGSWDAIRVIQHETSVDPEFANCANIAVGHSLGGYQAFMAGLLKPLLFDSLIAIEPVLKSRKQHTADNLLNLFKRLEEVIVTDFKTEAQFEKYMRKYSFYRDFDERILKDLMESEKVVDKDGVHSKTSREFQLVTYGGFGKAYPFSNSNLKNIEVPSLLIEGGAGTWNPPHAAEEVAQEMPNCQLETIQEGTHLLHAEMPDQVIAKIATFLDQRAQVERPQVVITDRKAQFRKEYNRRLAENWGYSNSKL